MIRRLRQTIRDTAFKFIDGARRGIVVFFDRLGASRSPLYILFFTRARGRYWEVKNAEAEGIRQKSEEGPGAGCSLLRSAATSTVPRFLSFAFCLLSFVFFSASAHAVPDGTGNEIQPYNVSIGTTSTPSATLEVQKRGDSAAPFMVSSAPTTDGDLMIVASTGNIGLGTSAPRANLVVGNDATLTFAFGSGSVYVQKNLEVDGIIYGDGSHLTGITAANSTANAVPVSTGTTLVDSGIYAIANGNVGIGTVSPAAMLEVGAGTPEHSMAPQGSAYVTGNFEVDGVVYVDGAIYGVDPARIAYDDAVYTTVKAALDHLLYVTPVISSFTNNINQIEIGTTVSSTQLNWTINKTITSQSLNQGIGAVVPASLRTYTDTASYTTNRTYTLTISDGSTEISANTSIYFRNKRYWGTSANASLNDAQIIALSSELSTGRTQTRNGMAPSAEYIYIVYPAAWGAATFTVNGLLNTDWSLSVQDHVNASGNTTSYNVYRTNNLLTGSYNIGVN